MDRLKNPLNKARRLAGLSVDYYAEAEYEKSKKQSLAEEKTVSVSRDINTSTYKDMMFYLVSDPIENSTGAEPQDIITHVNGTSFALNFIGAGSPDVPSKENWALYHENQKDKAVDDVNRRLQQFGLNYRVTENLELVEQPINEDTGEQNPHFDIERIVRSAMRYLNNESERYSTDPDLKHLYTGDYAAYGRVLQHIKSGNIENAVSTFKNMDADARKVLSNPAVIKNKRDRKAAAKFFNYDLLHESDDVVLSRAAHQVLNGASLEDAAKKHNLDIEELRGEVNLVKDHLQSGDYEKVYGKKPSKKMMNSLKESGTYDEKSNPSHEKSHEPINVVGYDKKKDDALVWKDGTAEDKKETPTQLKNLDKPSEQDQSGGGDLERKVKVPSSVTQALQSEIDEARKEAKKLDTHNKEASYFYNDLAKAFEDLLTHIKGGTVYDIKQAQIFMTSLMGPMLHKIPANVVKFLASGGEPRSLKSYMTDVSKKYPITGPRNTLK